MTDDELLVEWEEALKTHEGQLRCVFALGMTMGKFLIELAEGPDGTTLEVAREIAVTVNHLRQKLLDLGVDLSSIEEIWVQFQEATHVEGPTLWEHLLGTPPSSRL